MYLPLNHGGEQHKVAQDLMVESDNQRARILPWRDGLCISAELKKSLRYGAIRVGLHPDDSIAQGKLRLDVPILMIHAVVHSSYDQDQWTEWTHFSNLYFSKLMASRVNVPALPDPPETCPWAASFLYPHTRHLPEEVKDRILEHGRIAAAAAVDYAIWALRKRSSGRGPFPNEG